jgi:predicted MFS family arabinose efflux permease
VLSVVGLSALVYSIDGSAGKLISLVVAVIAISLFIFRESRTALPIMPLKIFIDRQRANASVGRFFYAGSSLAFFFLTPQLLQRALNYSPLAAGIAFLPMTILIFICSLQVSRLTRMIGNTRLMILGTFITVIGFVLSALIGIQHGYWLAVGLPMIFLGIGQGFTMSPLTAAGVANTSADIAGSASGVVNTVHQIGGSVGMSVIVALTSKLSPSGTSFRWATLGMALLTLVTLITAINIYIGEQRA